MCSSDCRSLVLYRNGKTYENVFIALSLHCLSFSELNVVEFLTESPWAEALCHEVAVFEQ